MHNTTPQFKLLAPKNASNEPENTSEIAILEAQQSIELLKDDYELSVLQLEKAHSELAISKQALATLQSEHRARLALFDQEYQRKKQELERALLELKARMQYERIELKNQLAEEMFDAEKITLQRRQSYLSLQKRSGSLRRSLQEKTKVTHLAVREVKSKEKQEETSMLSEWKENDRALIASLKRKLVEIKVWRHKIRQFASDFASTASTSGLMIPLDKRLKKLSPENHALYFRYAFDNESPESFVDRTLSRFKELELDTKMKIADQQLGPHQKSKIEFAGPVMIEKEIAEKTESPHTKSSRGRKMVEKLQQPVTPLAVIQG